MWPGDFQGVEMVWADGILILGLSVSMEFRSELQQNKLVFSFLDGFHPVNFSLHVTLPSVLRKRMLPFLENGAWWNCREMC